MKKKNTHYRKTKTICKINMSTKCGVYQILFNQIFNFTVIEVFDSRMDDNIEVFVIIDFRKL